MAGELIMIPTPLCLYLLIILALLAAIVVLVRMMRENNKLRREVQAYRQFFQEQYNLEADYFETVCKLIREAACPQEGAGKGQK